MTAGFNKHLAGMHVGEVWSVDDPDEQGRVQVYLPGIAEPTGWARPLGLGGQKRGQVWSLKKEDAVAVWFAGNNPEHAWYMPAGFGEDDLPEEARDGYPDVQVFKWDPFVMIIDEREESPRWTLRSTGGTEILDMDGKAGTVRLSGITKLLLESVGQIDIDAPLVTIRGRPVATGIDPI